MPDIRTTPQLDNFIRPNEDPLSGGGKWGQVDQTLYGRQLRNDSNQARGNVAIGLAWLSYYIPLTLDDDMQIWGSISSQPPNGDSYFQLLWDPVGGDNQSISGYGVAWQQQNADCFCELVRRDANVPTDIATDTRATYLAPGTLLLLQIEGTHVQTAFSTDGGSNWTTVCDVVDTTYRTDLHPILGIGGDFNGGMGWTSYGSGEAGTLTTANQLPYLGVGP